MTWRSEVEGIEARRRAAQDHGGAKNVAIHHERGKLTVRERIASLVDEGSLHEQGPIAGHSELDEDGNLISFTSANYVLAMGKVDGRPCVIGGEDFTQRGGSPTPAGLRKSVYAEDLAINYRLPLVRFLEGGGGSVKGTSGRAGAAMGDPVFAKPRFQSIGEIMATAPVVSAAVGAVAGFPAARLAASHLCLMTESTAQVMIAGPAVVERALGEKKTKEELGGPAVHARSGVVDTVCRDEADVVEHIRCFLGYLPTNVWEAPPAVECDDPTDRADEDLLSIIPRDRRVTYDMRRILEAVLDCGSFYEMTRLYGPSQITGLGRLGGQPVGVLANDTCFYAGAMSAEGAQKVRRFVDFCDTFHLPIVSFVDEPGFMIGSASEQAGTIRYGTSAIFAVMQSKVPWASVIVRKAYGVAAAAHFGPGGFVLSWPSAESGALPIEGGVAVAFRREIAAAPDPSARRRELEEQFAAGRSPFPRAEAFGVHDLIDPRQTRSSLCRWLEWTKPRISEQLGPRSYTMRP
jgi:acetyl-CoA carboxylase carboxyltransferase component